MKYYSSLIRLLLTILMISILSFQPYIASAEETTATGDVEVETDELEDIDYDTDDTDGVFLDIDVIPDDYDHSVYSAALSTVYLEENTAGGDQELSLLTDRSMDSEQIKTSIEEEKGVLTCVFPNTYNAVGELKKAVTNSFVKNISISKTESTVTVTIKYQSTCIVSTTYDEQGVSFTFSKASYSIRIHLPEGVTGNQITDIDYYYDHKFVLKIPGKWKSFYDQYPILQRNNAITSLKVSQSGNHTLITVKTSRLQGYKYEQQGD